MNADVDSYLEAVCRDLPKRVDRMAVKAELRAHIEEAAAEQSGDDLESGAALHAVLDRLGDPRKLARAYRIACPLPAALWSSILLLANVVCFAAGLALLRGLQDGFSPAAYGFHLLAAGKGWVLLGYSCMWLLSGFMLGRRYGMQAERRIGRMILPPLLPNYLFMLLVLFGIIPGQWFDSLLSLPFVFLCTASTLVFGWLARLGCRWGKRMALYSN